MLANICRIDGLSIFTSRQLPLFFFFFLSLPTNQGVAYRYLQSKINTSKKILTRLINSVPFKFFFFQIYTDPDAEKLIMGSTVYCIHHKEGCKWSDELRKLKAHLNTCKYDALPCSNNCGSQIPRVLMEDHMKYTCPQRRTRCEFCAKDFTGVQLEVKKKNYYKLLQTVRLRVNIGLMLIFDYGGSHDSKLQIVYLYTVLNGF